MKIKKRTLKNFRVLFFDWCPRQDLNLHPLMRGHAPQTCASTNSATRAVVVSFVSLRRCKGMAFFSILQIFFNIFSKKNSTD